MGNSSAEMGLAPALVRSAFLVNAVYAESSRVYGLTPQQGKILCILMAGPHGMGELGTMLGLAKSSLTGMVDRCAQRGLVYREPDPEDARAVQVSLTEEGGELAEEFYRETCRRVEELTGDLDAPDRSILASLLGRVVDANEVPLVFLELDETHVSPSRTTH